MQVNDWVRIWARDEELSANHWIRDLLIEEGDERDDYIEKYLDSRCYGNDVTDED